VVDAGDGSAELKRVFVTAAARGLGVGRALLGAAEERARELGATTMRLETGLPQTAAIALYERAGYRHVPRFGPYVEDPTSVCMERDLRVAPGSLPRWILRPALPDDATCASASGPTSSGSAGGMRSGSAAASSTAGRRSAPR
jgi:hypothetical protein